MKFLAKIFKSIKTRKGIVLLIIPLFIIFVQIFIRVILKKDINTIGITLSALGLGQILPFFYFDHFIANKILGIAPDYDFADEKMTITYKLCTNVEKSAVDSIKNDFMVAIFLNLVLFMLTVYFGLAEEITLHIIFGSICCIVSWYLLIFK